jgi:hypothetical protein
VALGMLGYMSEKGAAKPDLLVKSTQKPGNGGKPWSRHNIAER